MSTPSNTPDPPPLTYLSEDHLPEAKWILGGGFRFDQALFNIYSILKHHILSVDISEVHASLPLRWSLDWHQREKTLRDSQIRRIINSYNTLALPMRLSFNNPFLEEAQLQDRFSYGIIDEMLHYGKNQHNGLVVANDKLAALLHKQYPKLPISCHVNRLTSDRQKRTPLLYNKLLEQYDRVTLHPNDALRPSMYEAIEEKKRCIIIVNDPCMQNCPVRYEHLRKLAKQREEPFEVIHRAEEQQIIKRVRCREFASLASGQSCNLSIGHMKKLYELGYRNFAVQAESLKTPAAFICDIFHSIFTHNPQHSNRVAALCNIVINSFNNHQRPRLKSGMSQGAMDEY